MCLQGSGQGKGRTGARARGGAVTDEGKRRNVKEREKGPNVGLVFSQYVRAVRPVPVNRTSGRRTAAPTTTGSCRGRQGFTGVKIVRDTHHPVESARAYIPIRGSTPCGHVRPSSKSPKCGIAFVDPRNCQARRGRDFPRLIVAPRKRPVSLSHFEGTQARGSTKYPCDLKSGRKRKGERGRGFIDYSVSTGIDMHLTIFVRDACLPLHSLWSAFTLNLGIINNFVAVPDFWNFNNL